MKNKAPLTCDLAMLQRSLDEILSEAEEEVLSAHLATCEKCQRDLEQLAGHPAAWTRVGSVLKSCSATRSSLLPRPGSVPGDQSESATDFAVEWLEPSSSSMSIGRLGETEIHEVIGHGGMGVVLKGYQPELRRLVAVKMLAPQLAVSSAARQRFAREAQATAAILHPNVMPILTVNSSGTLPYIVMPYVACESLQQRIDNTGPLELVDILRIGMQTANGLAAAHAQGLVHRDVKPANILLEISVDKVMLTDFGLARAVDDASITRTGIIAGTPLYMSPEQSRGEPVDARSDLFSLGSVLYTLATGRSPFRAESTYGILRRLSEDTPRPVRESHPQFPVWFDDIVRQLLAKAPADRFAGAADVALLLEGCLAHVQQPDVVPLPVECPAPRRRLRLTALLAVSAAVLIAAGVGVLTLVDDTAAPVDLQTNSIVQDAAPTTQPTSSVESGSSESDLQWHEGAQEVHSLNDDLQEWIIETSELWPEVVHGERAREHDFPEPRK